MQLDNVIRIRIDSASKKKITDYAGSVGLSASSFLRTVALAWVNDVEVRKLKGGKQ